MLSDDNIFAKYCYYEEEVFFHTVPQSSPRAGNNFICFSEKTFNKLDNSELIAFADGTFKAFPSFFQQLFIIHIKVSNYVS